MLSCEACDGMGYIAWTCRGSNHSREKFHPCVKRGEYNVVDSTHPPHVHRFVTMLTRKIIHFSSKHARDPILLSRTSRKPGVFRTKNNSDELRYLMHHVVGRPSCHSANMRYTYRWMSQCLAKGVAMFYSEKFRVIITKLRAILP